MVNFFGNKKPYSETHLRNGSFRRTFKEDVSENDLVWHMDKRNRKVVVIDNLDWKIQFENELPKILAKNSAIEIPAYCYHRVIKGQGVLVLHIFEGDD